MAFPAVFMNDNFCTKSFVGDIRRRIVMAVRTGLGLGYRRTIAPVANSAVNPEIIEIVLMRHPERRGIGFMVAGLTFHLQVLEVKLVGKGHFSDR